jgi:hypothetical protein
MEELPLGGTIPPDALQSPLQLADVEALLRAHGALVRNVDNHHWQISCGRRSGLWLIGDAQGLIGRGLDEAALARLQFVLRQTGLLREGVPRSASQTQMGAAILWIGRDMTRIYWINDHALADGSPFSLGHWLHGEMSLHRSQRSVPYLQRIVAMLERIERALLIVPSSEPFPASGRGVVDHDGLDVAQPAAAVATGGDADQDDSFYRLTELLHQERPDLRSRVVGMLTLAEDQLDDALLFSIARDYLLPHLGHSVGSDAVGHCCGP